MRRSSPYIAGSQLLLFLLLLANGILFRHSHHLGNGRMIVHAHPYKTSDDGGEPNHKHSRKELLLLDVLFHATYVQPENTFTVTGGREYREIQLNIPPAPVLSTDSSSSVLLRGPPPPLHSRTEHFI